ncbi:hypothetical protein MJG53_015955 [Ovis ammon polii x Ovis aries]|uniref:Uncharacterized protein n=1 Tax=Ovis ammon polii x Ovis aries TaxID=2918886 RepID=A0ACB9UCU1_9CETA|nr:hypothetical protein MJG53_015955 [Ovis ammon polii x Ovis aries]
MHIPSSSVFPDTRKNVAIKKCFNITENGPKSTVDGSMSSKITTEASVLISHEDLRVSLDVLFLINSVTLAQVPTSPSQKLEPYAASSKHLYCAKRKDKTGACGQVVLARLSVLSENGINIKVIAKMLTRQAQRQTPGARIGSPPNSINRNQMFYPGSDFHLEQQKRSCGEWGCSLVAVHELLIAVASSVVELELYGAWSSVNTAYRLSSCGSQVLEHRAQ